MGRGPEAPRPRGRRRPCRPRCSSCRAAAAGTFAVGAAAVLLLPLPAKPGFRRDAPRVRRVRRALPPRGHGVEAEQARPALCVRAYRACRAGIAAAAGSAGERQHRLEHRAPRAPGPAAVVGRAARVVRRVVGRAVERPLRQLLPLRLRGRPGRHHQRPEHRAPVAVPVRRGRTRVHHQPRVDGRLHLRVRADARRHERLRPPCLADLRDCPTTSSRQLACPREPPRSSAGAGRSWRPRRCASGRSWAGKRSRRSG